MKQQLTQEELQDVLTYDPDTGIFTWKVTLSRRRMAGEVAGNFSCGYVDICIRGQTYRSHRLAWLYVYGEWPNGWLDHINGVRSDNRIINLREVTKSQNGQNVGRARANNKSGFLGVSPHRGRWRASIVINNVQTHLGTYDSPEQAHSAYIEAKRRMHPAHQPWNIAA